MARYTVDAADGPKRKTLYGKTRADVAAKLTKAMADRDGGLVYDDENMTVGKFLDKWLSDCVRGSVRESTFDQDSYLIRVHVKPALGRIKLRKLSPVHVQGFYRDRLDAGLSASTVNKIHTVLHKALSQAVRWSLISRNVTEAVKALDRRRRRCVRSLPERRVGSSKLPMATGSKLSTSSPSPPA